MLRDITTTYNTWNINEEAFETISNAIPGENQDLPETSEITLPKAQLGVSKKYVFNQQDIHPSGMLPRACFKLNHWSEWNWKVYYR